MTIEINKPEIEALLKRRAIGEKIDRAIAQIERGEGITPEQSRTCLEEKKALSRAEQRR